MGTGRKCVVCELPIIDEIDEKIRQGIAVSIIGQWVRSQGYNISNPSIYRHRKNHVDGIDTDEKPIMDKTRTLVAIEPEDQPQAIPAPFVVPQTTGERVMGTQYLLEQVLQNHLTTVINHQMHAMRGEIPYPNDMIRGVKSIMDVLKEFPSYDKARLKEPVRQHLQDHYGLVLSSMLDDTIKRYISEYGEKPWAMVNAEVESTFFVFPNKQAEKMSIELYPYNGMHQENWIEQKADEWFKELPKRLPAPIKSDWCIVSCMEMSNLQDETILLDRVNMVTAKYPDGVIDDSTIVELEHYVSGEDIYDET